MISWTRIAEIIETENKVVGCQGLEGEEDGELLFSGYRVLAMQDEKF